MKKCGGSESTIIIGPSKSVLVYALHSLENVLGLARFRISAKYVCMYVNDVKLFLSYSDYNCQRLLQEDLVALKTWCDYNLMRLNLGKCKCMCIFRRSRIISSYSLIGSR